MLSGTITMHQRACGHLRAIPAFLALVAVSTGEARAQTAASPSGDTVVAHPLAGQQTGPQSGSSDESLTVRGHHSRFQPAPVPGAPMGPPPDKPSAHLGRYKISGDQSKRDGYDTQTGAYIAPFGTAYTNAGPVSDGLAAHHEGVGGSGP